MAYYEKRFGTVAVEKGYVTIEQVAEAMRIQIIEDMGKEPHRPIGKIMLDQGFITKNQYAELLNVLDITAEDFG